MKPLIVFTGGGSAGHVSVNLALIPCFLREGWDVHYIGSASGIERELIARLPEVSYNPISTGKLRRYRSWENLKDPFRTLKGIGQAFSLLRKLKPKVIFSKGGFVSVPVVLAARLCGIPVIIHESDLTPGLANRISIPFAAKVCTTFPETLRHLPENKSLCVGAIVRPELFQGKAERGFALSGLAPQLPVMLVMGGSLGSKAINQAVRDALPDLLERFQVIHLTGKGQVDPSLHQQGYVQFEFINEELPDVLAMADLIVSRSGSNSIFEFLALRKPMLLIPLPKGASRGDQLLNAESFRTAGYAAVLPEDELSRETLMGELEALWSSRGVYRDRMEAYNAVSALETVENLLKQAAKP
ncbi:undecaprenyldiphospho-muramoylpentapeptide beta-N-acetylglucosaminyltransferase [Gorillibacterium sp. CAU 1737]|uniref:undecaprenyldiphospho-muramoylpentapeptide beta-N-acetylglucosaminyltransferase n=1 Tax=Gorillibacterium sp. CAU 1737 TaxID=3140362 RepID=UPI003260F801